MFMGRFNLNGYLTFIATSIPQLNKEKEREIVSSVGKMVYAGCRVATYCYTAYILHALESTWRYCTWVFPWFSVTWNRLAFKIYCIQTEVPWDRRVKQLTLLALLYFERHRADTQVIILAYEGYMEKFIILLYTGSVVFR